MRPSGRSVDQMRTIEMEPGYSKHAEGSCFVKFGNTHVLCTATLEDRAPSFLRDSGKGWITAEYGMLPRSTHSRMGREAARGKQSGRTQEIQRLIGRSLRAVCDLEKLGECQIRVDCDVIQADGGTRTASISGAYVAVQQCIEKMIADGKLEADPFTDQLAAISVGKYKGEGVLDLDYDEDSVAETDANIILTRAGGIVEIQATAEEDPFSDEDLMRFMRLARIGCADIYKAQDKALNR